MRSIAHAHQLNAYIDIKSRIGVNVRIDRMETGMRQTVALGHRSFRIAEPTALHHALDCIRLSHNDMIDMDNCVWQSDMRTIGRPNS